MWILPEIYILASESILERYKGSPHGNGPELCNNDSRLKEDLHKAVYFHVRYTHLLQKFDPKKLLLQLQRKKHQLNFGYLFQLTPLFHQLNCSYMTRMIYSHQSIIL